MPFFVEAGRFFTSHWENLPARRYSLDAETHGDVSAIHRLVYRFSEATGLGTY